ncbi:hypothetical protein FOZ62_012661, partial [Perkinsus olseni]
ARVPIPLDFEMPIVYVLRGTIYLPLKGPSPTRVMKAGRRRSMLIERLVALASKRASSLLAEVALVGKWHVRGSNLGRPMRESFPYRSAHLVVGLGLMTIIPEVLCRPSPPSDPSGLRPWNERHHVVFSKDNESFTYHARSYFDRPRAVVEGKKKKARRPLYPTWRLDCLAPGSEASRRCRPKRLEVLNSRGMPVNASTMELEGHWDDRHAVVFAKDNEDIYTDQRSFFDRLRDRPDFSVGGLSSGSEGSSLWLSLSVEEPTEPVKASWKLTQTTLHNRSREEDGGLGPKSYSLPKSGREGILGRSW